MRRLLFLLAAVLLATAAQAQVRISLNLNVNRQPMWGPTGYDHVEYYYLPDIDVYYNVAQRQYFYYDGGRWAGHSSLPSRYRGYDLYHSYKVVVNEPRPYLRDATYKAQYASYRGRHDQPVIRDSHEGKYSSNPRHPQHREWVNQQRQEKNSDRGNGHGEKHGRK